VGDVMLDALSYNLEVAKMKSRIIEKLGLEKKKYLVTTVHRPGNTDSIDNMRSIIEALGEIGMPVVFPLHPRTEKCLQEYGLLERIPGNVKLIKPLGYLDMLMLMANARKILTDSGGIQKEAYMLGVPCITLRENTEWMETLEGGWNVLVGGDKEKIIESISMIEIKEKQRNIFGEQESSERIVTLINNQDP
jgi:UDP-N-acetylglucosamine 2-epimerase (non-hydrolysing)